MSLSARLVAAGPTPGGQSVPPRVLLVHANPFQRVTPVPAYGLERLRTAAERVGARVEILDPYLVSEDPHGAARAAAERLRPDVIGLGVRIVDDCIVVDRVDAPADEPIDVTFLLPEVRELRRALGAAAPEATFVAGGSGFSAFPQECLEYLEIDWGVVGAGEEALAAICRGESLGRIPGLVRRGGDAGIAAYHLAFGSPTRREPLYAPANSFAVRTRIGCAMQCAYCTAANLLRRHANDDLRPVLDEIEETVLAAKDRGIGRIPLFFADDEFNLPDERHSRAVLQGIVERGLAQAVSWRGYFNPTPFSYELAELVLKTNGHVSITVDSAAEKVLTEAQKPFRRRHLDALVEMLTREGVPADLGLIFGLPGETEETVEETVAFVRGLPPEIEVAYSAGARVYPHTPLSRLAAKEPERLVGADDPSFLEPVVYSRPWPPRELARRLDEAFADLPHVNRVGVAYRSGTTALAEAYRTVLSNNGKESWASLLERAAAASDMQRSGAETLAACVQIAVWHNRFDLAATAVSRLLREDVPPDMSRRQLRLARLAYGGLAVVDRAKSALRR
ncbi:MAG TPA: radical SAM protein [Gaiellaceae bacterium]|nr:radical SAM protein [Gaiellaceae bacterium]